MNGAINLEDLRGIFGEEETINATAMMHLFLILEKQQPEGLIYAIVDNASYNHNRKLKEFLKAHPRIKLIYLLPY